MERVNNRWKELWNKRTADADTILSATFEDVFLELKRSNGLDVYSGRMNYESFMYQLEGMYKELSWGGVKLDSVYEVGCGSAPNLLWFAKSKNMQEIGGCDYSKGLINSAKTVLESFGYKEIDCCEAKEMDVSIKYDAVFSMGVFCYFENLDYALKVLELMLEKTKYSIGILSILDREKEEDFTNYRKATISDYEEKYKDLPKLFFSRKFFLDFGITHNLNVKFTYSHVPGYWNNEFVYNVYFWKVK